MKQIQRLFASLVLVCALALTAAADGIIQTGTPPPPPPPAAQSTPPTTEDETVAETAEGETPGLGTVGAIVLDFMCDLLTIF